MLHAEALSPIAPIPAPLAALQVPANLAISEPDAPRMFEVTFSAVEMDGQNLWREQAEVAFGQFGEAIRLAELRGKSELLICNIAPWIKIGIDDTSQVSEIELHILKILSAACQFLGRRMPECRLDLRHGEFGIRCYMGRDMPSDHVFEEDLLSDSR